MQRNTQFERTIEDLQFELDFPENVEIIREIDVNTITLTPLFKLNLTLIGTHLY